MAVLMTLEVPGGTTEAYERANELMGIATDDDAPAGLVSHVCAVIDGGIVVVDVWESPEALDEFARTRLAAALEGSGMPKAEPLVRPVHNMLMGAGEAAEVLVLVELPGFTTQAYDGIVARSPAHAGGGEHHPAFMHVAALEPSGEVVVADVWGSEAEFEEFVRTQIAPLAGDAMPAITPRFARVHNRLGAAARAVATT
jgi:hypothetical protein